MINKQDISSENINKETVICISRDSFDFTKEFDNKWHYFTQKLPFTQQIYRLYFLWLDIFLIWWLKLFSKDLDLFTVLKVLAKNEGQFPGIDVLTGFIQRNCSKFAKTTFMKAIVALT